MRIFDFILVLISTALLVVNQTALKIWLSKNDVVVWPLNAQFVRCLFSFEIFVAVISVGAGAMVWLYLLKRTEFSLLYPMVSISYVFGLGAAYFFFREEITLFKCVGVGMIVIGVIVLYRA